MLFVDFIESKSHVGFFQNSKPWCLQNRVAKRNRSIVAYGSHTCTGLSGRFLRLTWRQSAQAVQTAKNVELCAAYVVRRQCRKDCSRRFGRKLASEEMKARLQLFQIRIGQLPDVIVCAKSLDPVERLVGKVCGINDFIAGSTQETAEAYVFSPWLIASTVYRAAALILVWASPT